MVEKSKWKPFELTMHGNMVCQKQHHIPKGIAEISATCRDLTDAGMVILTILPFNSLFRLVQKTEVEGK
mgnify:CR=1 FL=1